MALRSGWATSASASFHPSPLGSWDSRSGSLQYAVPNQDPLLLGGQDGTQLGVCALERGTVLRARLAVNREQLLELGIIIGLALTLASFRASAATLTGKVVKVADGDTITILVGTEQHRIRLQGIDAPERRQPFGKASNEPYSGFPGGSLLNANQHQSELRPIRRAICTRFRLEYSRLQSLSAN